MVDFIKRMPWDEIDNIDYNSASWFKEVKVSSTASISELDQMNVDVQTQGSSSSPQSTWQMVPSVGKSTTFLTGAAQSGVSAPSRSGQSGISTPSTIAAAQSTAGIEQGSQLNQEEEMDVDTNTNPTQGSVPMPLSPPPQMVSNVDKPTTNLTGAAQSGESAPSSEGQSGISTPSTPAAQSTTGISSIPAAQSTIGIEQDSQLNQEDGESAPSRSGWSGISTPSSIAAAQSTASIEQGSQLNHEDEMDVDTHPSPIKKFTMHGPSEKSLGKRPRPPTPSTDLEEEEMAVDDEAPGHKLRPWKNVIEKLTKAPVTVSFPRKKKGTKARRHDLSGELMNGSSPSMPIDVDNLFVGLNHSLPFCICL